MGRPVPAQVVSGVRRSLTSFRPRNLGKRTLTKTFVGGLAPIGNSRRTLTFSARIASNLLKKELKSLEALPGTSRGLSTVLPEDFWDTAFDGEAFPHPVPLVDARDTSIAQDLASPLSLSTESKPVANAVNVASPGSAPKRRPWPPEAILTKDDSQYEDFQAYSQHFKPLLEAELEDAREKVLHRLSTWDVDRLVAEGYTLRDLRVYKYQKPGEKAHDGYTFSFVPRAGELLGDNLFIRGSQVTVVLDQNTPLHFVNPASNVIEGVKGTVVSSSAVEVRVRLSVYGQTFAPLEQWRLDVSPSDFGHLRMLEAISALQQDPGEIKAACTLEQEYALRGTYLRDKLLKGWSMADTIPEDENQNTVLTSNSMIADWTKRYLSSTPKVYEDDPSIDLNASQVQAIAQMLGHPLSLVQGPPGTGKTRTIIEAVRLLKAHFGIPHSVMVCTYTNTAVDNLVEGLAAAGLKPLRIGNEGSVREGLEQWTVQTQMRSHPMWNKVVRLQNERAELQGLLRQSRRGPKSDDSSLRVPDPAHLIERIRLMKQRIDRLESRMHDDILRTADVVCTTCLSAGTSMLRLRDFPIVFLDEASMSTEPASLIPLMRGCEHLALIGDHKQLPPVITSVQAQQGGLSKSLFERLIETKACPNIMLNTQYRMHPTISRFPSQEFYDTNLKDGVLMQSGRIPDNLSPPKSRHLSRRKKPTGQIPSVLFIHHDNREIAKDRSRANVQEMYIVAAIIEDLLLSNPDMMGKDIGIISPYVAQIRMFESHLKSDPEWKESFQERLGELRALQMQDIEIKTVDGFEGREKEVIIFSTVRNNPYGQIGFLADRRRMNVALTRAKRALFVVGSMTTLAKCRQVENNEDLEKGIAKLMIQGSGDEWRKYIQFVLAEELFTEYGRPDEYRSADETLAFEHAAKFPIIADIKPILAI